jgi:putative ABC transport system substrate-binding protein
VIAAPPPGTGGQGGHRRAAAWPLAARAQQPAMPVIGFLHGGSPVAWADPLRGFHRGLKEVGFVEGENVAIVYRWADGQLDRLPAVAAELARRQVSVIAAFAPTAALAAKAATATIPIVFLVGSDPVGLGLVASLARPSGNLTGVNFFVVELDAKRLELLRELVPTATRVAVLVNPANPANAESTVRDVETAARAMGLQIQVLNASDSREIDAVFTSVARDRPDAIHVGGDQLFTLRSVQLVQLVARLAVPATYSSRHFTDIGGLMSYGTNTADSYRQIGVYAGRVLKGAKPADLPVEQSTKPQILASGRRRGLVDRSDPATAAVAKLIIEFAKVGERNPERLCAMALQQLSK